MREIIFICLVLSLGWILGYLSALYMKNEVDKQEHLEQNKCPDGYYDWDDCPNCRH